MNHSVSCVKQSMAYVMSLDIMMSATCAMQHIACNAWHLQNGNMECPPDIHCNFIMANHVSHDSKPMVHGQPGFMHEKGFFFKGPGHDRVCHTVAEGIPGYRFEPGK